MSDSLVPNENPLAPYMTPTPYRAPDFGYSLFETWHYRYAAWTERAVNAAKASVLASREDLVQQATSLRVAELHGRRDVSRALQEAEEQEYETEFSRTVRGLPAAEARGLLARETEIERRTAVRSGYRRLRLTGGAERLIPPAPPAQIPAAELDIEVSDRQIEAEALRAVAILGALPVSELKDRYLAWQQDVHKRLPDYAAEDIIGRADKMLTALQSAG